MADPISLMAVAGLVYAGRNLSTKSVPPKIDTTVPVMKNPEIVETVDFQPRYEEPHKMEMASFATIAKQQRTGGQEVLNMRNRMYDTGRMNNLSPVEKQLVGPGLCWCEYSSCRWSSAAIQGQPSECWRLQAD